MSVKVGSPFGNANLLGFGNLLELCFIEFGNLLLIPTRFEHCGILFNTQRGRRKT